MTTGLAMTAPHGGPGKAILLVAVLAVLASASKVLPATAAARLSGLSRTESWTVGLLMNTRGLTELIVLSVLAGSGLIGPTTYTVLVGLTILATSVTPWLLTSRWLAPPPPTGEPTGVVAAAATGTPLPVALR